MVPYLIISKNGPNKANSLTVIINPIDIATPMQKWLGGLMTVFGKCVGRLVGCLNI